MAVSLLFLLNLILGLCLLSDIWHCVSVDHDITDLSELHYVTVHADLPNMHKLILLAHQFIYALYPQNVHPVFFEYSIKNQLIWIIFDLRNPGEISKVMLLLYLGKCRSHASDCWSCIALLKKVDASEIASHLTTQISNNIAGIV